jgi:hypothetical protein
MSEDEKPPICPGCQEYAKEGDYPPGVGRIWWCNDCLLNKIKKARRRD